MCQYTQYIFACDHPASNRFRTQVCTKDASTGHHHEDLIEKVLPEECHRCCARNRNERSGSTASSVKMERESQSDKSKGSDQSNNHNAPDADMTLNVALSSANLDSLVENSNKDSTDEEGSQSKASTPTDHSGMQGVQNDDEMWYIKRRKFGDPGFTNLDPFSAAGLQAKKTRPRRESSESLSPKSLPTKRKDEDLAEKHDSNDNA